MFCALSCYAKKGKYNIDSVNAGIAARGLLALSDPEKYVESLEKGLQREKKRARREGRRPAVRINVSGDLFSRGFIHALSGLFRRHRDVDFYLYTRSWRIPTLRREIERLLMPLENVTVYASTDPTTGPPPAGWPEAGIGGSYTGVEFVCPKTVKSRRKGKKTQVTCSTCRACFSGKAERSGGVVFMPH